MSARKAQEVPKRSRSGARGGSPKKRAAAGGSNRPGGSGRRGSPKNRSTTGGSARRGAAADERSPQAVWLEQLREGIVIAVANPVRIVYANPAMAAKTGYTREELLALRQRGIEKLIHPEDRRIFFSRFRARLAGKAPPDKYEVRGLTKNRETVWFMVHSTRIEYEGRPAVLAAFTDTTELKTAVQAIQEREVKLKAQYRGIPVPTYTWQRRGRDFVLVDYNDAARKVTRGRIKAYLGVTLRKFSSDRPEIIRSVERCFRRRAPEECEMEYRFRTTGEHKILAVKYAFVPPDLVLVHTEDVTARCRAEAELRRHHEALEERIAARTSKLREINERLKNEIAGRKETEALLRASEARYRAIVEDQTELIVRFKPDTILTFVNDAACRFLDAPRKKLIGAPFSAYLSKENRAFIQKKLAALTPRRPVETHDQKTVFLSGEVVWQQWTNRAFFDAAGRITEYQAVGRDNTERKLAEEALERSNRELGILNAINSIINSPGDSRTILGKILPTISEYCGARFAGLFEIDHEHRELRLVASYGLPPNIRKRVMRVGMDVPSIGVILASSGVIVAEEDMPFISSGEYDTIKNAMGLKRILAFVSRSEHAVNFLAFLGSERDEDVGDRMRNFLGIVGNQLGIALERLRLVAALGQSKAELKKLTASLLSTTEEERRRMAIWLHDDMGQHVVALNVEFDLLEKRINAGEPVAPAVLGKIRQQLRDITNSIRQISYALHPPMLDELGLVPALQRYVERFVSGDDLAVTIRATGFDEPLSPLVGITLYRVAQEALTNVVRHAGASRVTVQITKGYPRVIMKIEDDGRGFSTEDEETAMGIGILGMRERIERLGGDFSIRTSPGKGTNIRVRLPLEVEDAG